EGKNITVRQHNITCPSGQHHLIILANRQQSEVEGFFAQSRLKSSRNCVIMSSTNQNLSNI
ncbi:MAG: hypothetical protein KBS59_06465, partial [Clostridiales bacterium]|nr:hypothetical protein [Clostridiales bacterium]